MILRAVVILLLTALPAGALTLADLAGRWRGEGAYTAGTDPAQRLRCQVRGQPAGAGRIVLTGRCATAQGGQSFVWLLTDLGAGRILAEDRDVNDPSPEPFEGRIGPEGLRFATGAGGWLDLSRDTDGLRLRLQGQDGGRPVTGEARLSPAD